MPLVSVALSTYNGARFLREQIDSVLAQQGVELELVAVDDGSTDGTTDLLEAYARQDTRVRWSPNPGNLGPTRSFERAMSLCAGEFIAPCDQDDVWAPEKLRRLLDSMEGVDLAYSDSAYVDADGRDLGDSISRGTRMLEGRRPAAFLFGNSVSGHASLVRRSLLDVARPFPEGAYHDWWLALCAAGRAGVRYVPEPLVRFRRHDRAFSPMGREHAEARARRASSDWLEQRCVLSAAYAGRALRDSEAVGTLHAQLMAARAGGPVSPLLGTLWTLRDAAPRWSGWASLDALKLWTRFAKKLRRAQRAGRAPR